MSRRAHISPPPPPPPPSPPVRPAARRTARAPEIFSARPRRRGKLLVAFVALVAAAAIGAAVLWVVTDVGDEPEAVAAEVSCRVAEAAVEGNRNLVAPELTLEPGVAYRAVIHTSCGEIHLDLADKDAPRAVANFVHLARAGFYDGLAWHLVATDLMIQSGNPNGEHGVAPDDPGYLVEVETPEDSSAYRFGALAFWGEVAGEAGSQFFIVAKDPDGARSGVAEALPVRPLYAVFRQVEPSSFEVVEAIAALRTEPGEGIDAYRPLEPAVIERVEIIEAEES